MRRLGTTLGLAALAVLTSAHVGSPDVYYRGAAGPYAVTVVVRPPGVVPGQAAVTVRVERGDARRVTVQPVFWYTSTGGAPRPDVATPVSGEPGTYGAALWLMTAGSYSVRVTIEGSAGAGTVFVPVISVAMRQMPMGRATGVALAALGAFLAVGLLSILGAAVREGTLEPGDQPDARRRRRARLTTAVTALLLVGVLSGGRRWWDAEDAAHRRMLYRPLHITARAHGEGAHRALQVALDDPVWPRLGLGSFVPDHGKLMHLFVVRDSTLDAFAHLHPARLDSATFEAPLPPLPAGRYRVYADLVDVSGFARTLTDTIDIADPPPGAGWVADTDDSWRVAAAERGTVARLEDGSTMTWERGDGRIAAGRPGSLRFVVRAPDGTAAALEPYLGMRGHAAVTRDDGSVFVHLHPMGTISLASQLAFERRERGDTSWPPPITAPAPMPYAMHQPDEAAGVVTFPYAFPTAGRYHLWVQVRRAGRVLTGVFVAEAAPSAR